jgi:NADH:ubiquinone oxidoreductase subunit K
MPSNIHDLVFFVGMIVLVWGPWRMFIAKSPPPISSSVSMGLVLTAFTINYITLGFYWSAVAQATNVVLWFALTVQAYRYHHQKAVILQAASTLQADQAAI